MDERELIETDIQAFLDQNERKELLRFVTVGSVDDGKSTLIGRLLHDTKGVYDDQLKDASRTTATGETAIDFARITDGLRAEREQGITIDVAYRYFSTPHRKFIIADTPGHVQYTRNMATGASTANVAIILIDARYGVLKQSRRHAYIASLLGIPNLLVCINKMDLKDYDQDIYNTIVDDFQSFSNNLAFGAASQKRTRGAGQCAGFHTITYIPISALMGINVVDHNDNRTPWYQGQTVLEYLESVDITTSDAVDNFRFPVQYVIRPNLNYRGYAGQVVSGTVQVGDSIKVHPSGKTSTVSHIDTYNGPLTSAYPPLSVVLRLADEVDISRGDLLSHLSEEPLQARDFDAMVVWMSETPLYADKSYIIKIGTRYVRTNIAEVTSQVVLDTLESVSSQNKLELNEIGRVAFTAHQPIAFDSYKENRTTGAFIIIDSLTNNTVGAGMILQSTQQDGNIQAIDVRAECQVSPRERTTRLSQLPSTLLITGRASSGRSSLAYGLERRLFDKGYLAAVIDHGDKRYTQIDQQGIIQLARRMNDAGLIVIVCADSATPEKRALLTEGIGEQAVRHISVTTPEDVCKSWNKGSALANNTDFSHPSDAIYTVDLSEKALDIAVDEVCEKLIKTGLLIENQS
jgi:bifunctional enzyme CysN/CysC